MCAQRARCVSRWRNAENAAEDASEAANEAAQATERTAEQAGESAEAAAEDAAQEAEQTADQAVSGATPEADVPDFLTVEDFDYDQARDFIAESDLNDNSKSALTGLMQSAQDNPTLLETVLEQIRDRLDLGAQ